MKLYEVQLGRVITQNKIIFIHAKTKEEAKKEFEKIIAVEHNEGGWTTVYADGSPLADEYFIEMNPEESI